MELPICNVFSQWCSIVMSLILDSVREVLLALYINLVAFEFLQTLCRGGSRIFYEGGGGAASEHVHEYSPAH